MHQPNNSLPHSILFGIAVGDALGVPVEFKSRAEIRQNPVNAMIGYGTYNQPPGTWSDDSSMTFCLAEAMTGDFSIQAIADNFVKWKTQAYWTAHGEVFDIGISTRKVIDDLIAGTPPSRSGGTDEYSNGNGSLMRILPLVLMTKNLEIADRFALTQSVSAITHAHIRSVIACFYYLEFARLLVQGIEKYGAYRAANKTVMEYLKKITVDPAEFALFERLFNGRIYQLAVEEIRGSGYVLHSLEASLWCLLTSNDYPEAVLKAVNLGEDTDTTAAITGGIAAIAFGPDSIPQKWMNTLSRKEDIAELANRLASKYPGNAL